MESLGTEGRPIESGEPMVVADALIRDVFLTPSKYQGLWHHESGWYLWYGEQWKRITDEEVEDACWRELADAWVKTADGTGIKRFAPTRAKVGDVMRAMASQCRLPHKEMPFWLHGPPTVSDPGGEEVEGFGEDPGVIVSFKDSIVDVRSGYWVARGEGWFDPVVLPVGYDPKAACPRWMKCLEEWGRGDEKWGLLLQRWFGYCLMRHRRYAKWLLMYGKARAGKGTIAAVLKMLVGDGFMGAPLQMLGERFGMEHLCKAQVLSINEVTDLEFVEGAKAVGAIKSILGGDPMTIDRKGRSALVNKIVQAAPMLQSNEIPKLCNTQGGLSVKMLTLPFTVSFAGHEDTKLLRALEGELAGVAAWAVEGARQLEASGGGWPEPEEAAETVERFRLVNNPFDSFLEARFLKNPEGFVRFETLWRQWQSWRRENGVPLKVGKLYLPKRVEEGSTWDLSRARLDEEGNPSPYGKRGFLGLSLRRERDDEAGS